MLGPLFVELFEIEAGVWEIRPIRRHRQAHVGEDP
jgi:hypothetical protein